MKTTKTPVRIAGILTKIRKSTSEIRIYICTVMITCPVIANLINFYQIHFNFTQVLITVYNATIYGNFNNTIAFDSLKLAKMF
jgi:hypothetical protein